MIRSQSIDKLANTPEYKTKQTMINLVFVIQTLGI
jgi:hypothetical protein